MILGIDASNIRAGGGIAHLAQLLNTGDSQKEFSKIVIWGGKNTLEKIADVPRLKKINPPLLNRSLPFRIFWQVFLLRTAARKMACNVLFVPGGSFATRFRPIVTMSQNLLPFESKELFRFGWSIQTLKLLLLRFSQSRSFRKANGVIFLTHYARDVVSLVSGRLKNKTMIIPHGLDTRFFSAPKPQKSINQYSKANPLRILYVSIVDVYKHQWHVAEAVARLRNEGYPVCLDFVGPAYLPALKCLKKTLKQLDPEATYLKYKGPVSYEELHEHYASSQIFAFASSCENMPNILLEAMASGLPIACSNKGPMPEVLCRAGLYFNPESPENIANAIRRLILSPELRLEKAQAAFKLAQQYSWKRCAQETFGFLAQFGKVRVL